MTEPKVELPVPVLEKPHWRIVIRPSIHKPERLESLSRCVQIVRESCVRLRGWPYPMVNDERIVQGSDWAGSWSQFMSHLEYWRMYQSGQFLHLTAIREVTEPDWRPKLEQATRSHLGDTRDWEQVPGFIDLRNFVWCMTEIYEFAAGLYSASLDAESLEIEVQLRRIKDFVLTTSMERAWSAYRAASDDTVGRAWQYARTDFLALSREHCLDATSWMLERFGWFDPPRTALKSEQEVLLERRW